MLYAALESEYGVRVQVTCNPDHPITTPTLRAKQILYRFKSLSSEFQDFVIRLDRTEPDKFVWITKEKEPNLGGPKPNDQ